MHKFACERISFQGCTLVLIRSNDKFMHNLHYPPTLGAFFASENSKRTLKNSNSKSIMWSEIFNVMLMEENFLLVTFQQQQEIISMVTCALLSATTVFMSYRSQATSSAAGSFPIFRVALCKLLQ